MTISTFLQYVSTIQRWCLSKSSYHGIRFGKIFRSQTVLSPLQILQSDLNSVALNKPKSSQKRVVFSSVFIPLPYLIFRILKPDKPRVLWRQVEYKMFSEPSIPKSIKTIKLFALFSIISFSLTHSYQAFFASCDPCEASKASKPLTISFLTVQCKA